MNSHIGNFSFTSADVHSQEVISSSISYCDILIRKKEAEVSFRKNEKMLRSTVLDVFQFEDPLLPDIPESSDSEESVKIPAKKDSCSDIFLLVDDLN